MYQSEFVEAIYLQIISYQNTVEQRRFKLNETSQSPFLDFKTIRPLSHWEKSRQGIQMVLCLENRFLSRFPFSDSPVPRNGIPVPRERSYVF